MNSTPDGLGLGWLPDYPDFRDVTPEKGLPPAGETQSVPALLEKVGVAQPLDEARMPANTDLRAGFSPIEDQGQLGSCTAHAGVGLLEYFERTAGGKHVDASRRFLYKATRNLMGQTGDTGAFLRVTMQALVAFGVPPEEYWPYDIGQFDIEPSAFCYAFAQDYKAIQYYRLDPAGTRPDELLLRIKTNLSAGLPSMFGFTVFSSYLQAAATGAFPFPMQKERRVGGHAIIAAGYDDTKQILNSDAGAQPTRGAFLIRNSWGTQWGQQGYGWLPYAYVQSGLATDWWSLVKSAWIDTGVFKTPA